MREENLCNMLWCFFSRTVCRGSMRASYLRFGNPTRCVIAGGTDDELIITGFESTRVRTFVFWFVSVATLGLVPLCIYWKPSCRRWRYPRCSLSEANVVSVKTAAGDVEFCKVFRIDVTNTSVEDAACEVEIDVARKNSPSAATTHRDSLSNGENWKPVRNLDDIFPDDGQCDGQRTVRFFIFHGLRFVFDEAKFEFSLLNGLDGRVRCGELAHRYDGLTSSEQKCRRQLFGENIIDFTVPSYWTLFYKEVLNPFYVFQICSLVLWSFDDYYIYAVCVLLMSLVSVGFELYETRTQLHSLYDMVAIASETPVCIRRRDRTVEVVARKDLTPGDVIVMPPILPDGYTLPCDVVVLNGSCMVDESVLTGESVPTVKLAPTSNEADEWFFADKHQKHVLFCGTRVIQGHVFGGDDLACLVVRTGFSSAKGSLVRSVLYPKLVSFEFYRDSMVFLLLLAIVALVGTVYSMVIFVLRGMALKKVFTDSLDIITIVVPPTLPAAMTVGIWYSQRRLKSKLIYSTSPQRINLCGKLNLVCFDKTGTLTEEGLELNGVVPCQQGAFSAMADDLSTLPFNSLLSCLVTCHSLALVNGNVIGEPLDLRIFESTKWVMDVPLGGENSSDSSFAPTVVKPPGRSGNGTTTGSNVDDLIKCPPLEVGVLRQFPFSPDLQRCTVIARRLGDFPMSVYCKGAPEKIAALCNNETIPIDFRDLVDRKTMHGHRVLALACRILPKKTRWHHLQRMKREDLEREMEFLGLVIFRNRLKPPTTIVIDELRLANIRCVMVTGDSLLTALCVARECHMINGFDQYHVFGCCDDIYTVTASSNSPSEDYLSLNVVFKPYPELLSATGFSYQNCFPPVEIFGQRTVFAISGPDFALIREKSSDVLKHIVSRGVVFARMRPDQKAQLIEIFQELGYVVGMCGDGANDCSALKTAHAGVSLSDLEASVAAPFTCRVQTIECIPELIKEGRCALVTSFGVFKYMAMYSMIQFVSVVLLYTMDMFFADYMYLFIDLVIITVIAILMGRTEAYDQLDQRQPSVKLLSAHTVLSLLTHLIVLTGVQLIAIFYLRSRKWYAPVHPDPNDELSLSWETTTLFIISCYQYLIMALVFSSGPPYRKPFYSNYPFVSSLLLFSAAITLMLFERIDFLDTWLELVPISPLLWRFQLSLFLLALLNLAISTLTEFMFSCLDTSSSESSVELSTPPLYI